MSVNYEQDGDVSMGFATLAGQFQWRGGVTSSVLWGSWGLGLFYLGNKEVGDCRRPEDLGTFVLTFVKQHWKEKNACDIFISQHG